MKRIDFNPEGVVLVEPEHYYRTHKGERFESVTTVLKRFQPAFDADGSKAAAAAERNGISVEDQRSLWAYNRITASMFGTAVHKHIEGYIRNGGRQDRLTALGIEVQFEENTAHEGIVLFFDWLSPKAIQSGKYQYYTEQIISDPDLNIAGTVDLIIQCGDKFVLIDWKTNKEITTAPYNEGDACYAPFEEFADCHLDKYQLQMMMYGAILQHRFGIDIAGMYIGHLPNPETAVWHAQTSRLNVWNPVRFARVCAILDEWRKSGVPGSQVRKELPALTFESDELFPADFEFTKTNMGAMVDRIVGRVEDGYADGLSTYLKAHFLKKLFTEVCLALRSAYMDEIAYYAKEDRKMNGATLTESNNSSKDYTIDPVYAKLSAALAAWKDTVLDAIDEPEFRKPVEIQDMLNELQTLVSGEVTINPPDIKRTYFPKVYYKK